MQRFSYIGSLKDAIDASGLTIIDRVPLLNNSNLFNCASDYILKTDTDKESCKELARWVDPIFRGELVKQEGSLRNSEGLWYPVLREIPFFRQEDAKFVLNPEVSGGGVS